MANILRKIGDEFARSDTNGYKALSLWFFIFALTGIFLFIGTAHSNPSLIVVCIALGCLLTIPYIWYFIRWVGNALNDLVSRRWDKMGIDNDEVKK